MNPLDLPVHPAFVHIPLAMLGAAWVCVLGQHLAPERQWGGRVRLFETIGVAFLVPSIVAGFVDTRGWEFLAERRWDMPLIWHFLVALAASAVFAGHWAWRREPLRAAGGTGAAVDVGLSTLGMWLLVLAGLIAAEMVYAQ